MQTKKPHVVIVGSGFGGIYTAKYLKSAVARGEIDVTLISRVNYFLFTPLLHEVATGGLSPGCIIEADREIFRDTSIRLLQDEVRAIDLREQYLEAGVGRISYDYLVLASGAGTNYRNIPGAKEHTFGLKDVNEALELRNHIIDIFERFETYEHDGTSLNFVVVGGGPTGVEVAGEIEEFVCETLAHYYAWDEAEHAKITVYLIASGTGILPYAGQKLQAKAAKILTRKHIKIVAGASVSLVTEDGVTLDTGEFIHSFATVWAAGVEPVMPNFLSLPPGRVKGGRIIVDEYLRVAPHATAFALGDVATFEGGDGPWKTPMLAQAAVQEAKVVAKNILRTLQNKSLHPFVYRPKGFLVSLGRWQAAGELYGFTFSGPLMWFIWRTVYLFKFLSWRKRIKIMVEWTVNLFYPRDISTL